MTLHTFAFIPKLSHPQNLINESLQFNHHPSSGLTIHQFYAQLSDETLQRLQQAYQGDFAAFGYDPESFVKLALEGRDKAS